MAAEEDRLGGNPSIERRAFEVGVTEQSAGGSLAPAASGLVASVCGAGELSRSRARAMLSARNNWLA
jgi:hypothetical protein